MFNYIQMIGITVEAKGGARVHWTETRIQTTGPSKIRNRFRKGQAETIDYTAEDGYFRERVTLLQHGNYHCFVAKIFVVLIF